METVAGATGTTRPVRCDHWFEKGRRVSTFPLPININFEAPPVSPCLMSLRVKQPTHKLISGFLTPVRPGRRWWARTRNRNVPGGSQGGFDSHSATSDDGTKTRELILKRARLTVAGSSPHRQWHRKGERACDLLGLNGLQKPVHKKVVSNFQTFHEARAPMTGLEPASEGSLQVSGRIHYLLSHECPIFTLQKIKLCKAKLKEVFNKNFCEDGSRLIVLMTDN
ncbi:hypothetical protein PoB_001588300 [Plakobranchus ocellatus]|uniref:Uncharacterized protein n=1 Tax=Plakobranchus ocellatus TaxID=259542 RepID=A0AAV3Z4K2_9GAST|nr:hypothetical protein PoB_001588300 [Plakobranchus ocellatus]